MKLLRIQDINNLPDKSYGGNENNSFAFTPAARLVLSKELFSLGLQNKEYNSVNEIYQVISQHKKQLLPQETLTPELSIPLDNQVNNELITNEVESVIKEDINTKDINTKDINTKDINTKDINTEDINTEDTNTEDTNTEDTNTENILVKESLINTDIAIENSRVSSKKRKS